MTFTRHTTSQLITVTTLWLLLSGHTEALILGLGFISVLLTCLMAARLEVVDHESQPTDISYRLPGYWLWLAMEIVKSNLLVARHILRPSMNISPSLVRIATGCRSDICRTILANSITLTPGTVALNVKEDFIEVHALTREIAEHLQSGTMSARVPDRGERN